MLINRKFVLSDENAHDSVEFFEGVLYEVQESQGMMIGNNDTHPKCLPPTDACVILFSSPAVIARFEVRDISFDSKRYETILVYTRLATREKDPRIASTGWCKRDCIGKYNDPPGTRLELKTEESGGSTCSSDDPGDSV